MRKAWPVYELGELVTISSGGTPSKSIASYWGGAIPWVSAKDLKRLHISNSIDRLTEAGAMDAGLVPAGTVLVLVRGMTLFRRVPIGLATCELAFNQDIKGLKPKSSVDPEYLAWALAANEPLLMRQVDTAGHGTGRLNTEALLSCPVTLPTLRVQGRIVEILRTWDEAIEMAERLIGAKQNHLEARREELAWRRRDNRTVQLSKILVQSRSRVGPGRDLRVFSVTKDGLVPQDEHFNKRIANEDVSRHMLVEQGNFAFSGLNFWLGSVDVSLGPEPFCISPDYKVFKIGADVVPGFFRHLVRTDRFRQILRSCAVERASVVRKNFDRETFLASEVPLPDIGRQEAVLNVLSAAEQELTLLRRQRDALATQKRGLMQKLLTGEWTVKAPESQEAAE